MNRFKFVTVVAAGLLSLASISAFSQTANLNVGGVPTATCSYSSVSIDNTGAINVSCATAVNYTGGGTPPPAGSYTLTVTVSPASAGSISATNSTGGALTLSCGSSQCTGTFTASQTVILTASPSGGATFSGWTNNAACSGTGTCSITMDANKSVTANFSTSSTPPPTPSGVVMLSTPPLCGTANGSMSSYTMGTTYSFPLPHTSTGQGLIGISTEGGVGTNAQLELSISKTPGDWTSAKTLSQLGAGYFGIPSTTYPFYQQGPGYLTMGWRPASDTSGFPVVPASEQWYINFRMSNATGWLTIQLSSPGCN